MKSKKVISVLSISVMMVILFINAAAFAADYASWDVVGGNRITNASCEENFGSSNWASATPNANGVLRRKGNGGYSKGYMELDIKDDGTTLNTLQFYNNAEGSIEQGKVYKLTFWAKLDGVESYNVNYIWFRSTGEYALYSDRAGVKLSGNEWTQYTVYITANTDADAFRLMVQLGGNSAGGFKVLFDEFNLVELSASGTSAPVEPEKEDIPPTEAVVTKVTFQDISSHWAKSDIEAMASKGIIKGKDESHFEPEANITRAEFLTLITRCIGLSGTAYNGAYADVSSNDWYAQTIQAAKDAGLIDDGMIIYGNFQPEANITREEMTSLVSAAYLKSGKTVNDSELSHFTDKDQINSWAVKYVQIANALDIIKGVTETTFEPKANATRAQSAVIIKRLLEKI